MKYRKSPSSLGLREAVVVLSAQLVVNVSTNLVRKSKGSIDRESKVQTGPNTSRSTIVQKMGEVIEMEIRIICVSTGQIELEVVTSKQSPQNGHKAIRLSGVSSRVLLIGVVKQERGPIGIWVDVGIAGNSSSNNGDGSPRIEDILLIVHVGHVSIETCGSKNSKNSSSVKEVLIGLENERFGDSGKGSNGSFRIPAKISRVHVFGKSSLIKSSHCTIDITVSSNFCNARFVSGRSKGGNRGSDEKSGGGQNQGCRIRVLEEGREGEKGRSGLVSPFNSEGKMVFSELTENSRKVYGFDGLFGFFFSDFSRSNMDICVGLSVIRGT